jgi:hypothetical protein
MTRMSNLNLSDDTIDHASRPYLGQWNRLISTTNWGKGRIIHEWRQALIAADAPSSDYSDDAWSHRVGNVTGQHVGRLRRVYERFGGVYQEYAGLYWSHFQAATDWNDAEMWLEGAVQNRWSVEEMRRERWQALGAIQEEQPHAKDVVAAELDEDFANGDADGAAADVDDIGRRELPEKQPAHDVAGDELDTNSGARDSRLDENGEPPDRGIARDASNLTPFQPFADLPPLPDDLNEAFESFKLAILRHKTTGWREISRDDIVASLKALVELAMAPSG